jgi:hypothetical protein
MAAYKMAAVKVTPPNDFPLGLIRSHMVVIHICLMLCDLQRVVRDLCPTLYIKNLFVQESQLTAGKFTTDYPTVKSNPLPEKFNSLSYEIFTNMPLNEYSCSLTS